MEKGGLRKIEGGREVNRRAILEAANLLGLYLRGESVQPPSGIAIDIENQQRDAALKEKADNMEQAEKQILDLWSLWEGVEFKGEIHYAIDFSIRDFDRDVQNTLDSIGRADIQSKTLLRELHKKLARNLLPKIDKEKMEKIDAEIEKFTITASQKERQGKNNGE